MKNAVLEQATRMMERARRGQVRNTTNFQEWYRDHGIPMAHCDAPLTIDFSHRLSLERLTTSEIVSLIEILTGSHTAYVSQSRGALCIPVYFIDSKVTYQWDSLPPLAVRFLNSHNLSDTARAVLRVPSTRTIVGPLAFDRILSLEELQYALHYVRLGFTELISVNTQPHHLLYQLLSRSTESLKGVKREFILLPSPATRLTIDGPPAFEWTAVLDPFSESFRMTVQMMFHFVELKLGRLTLVLAPSLTHGGLPVHFHTTFFPVVLTKGIARDSVDAVISAPLSWATYRVQHTIMVAGVTQCWVARGARRVRIGANTYGPLDNGFFTACLPVGRHPAQGLAAPSVLVDTFLPVVRFVLPSNEEIVVVPDNRLHVLSFVISPDSENYTRMMLYTLQANVSCDFKLWLIEGFRSGLPQSVDTEIIPQFWPFFLPRPFDRIQLCKAARFALLDLFMPLEVTHVLFLDQSAFLRGDAAIFKRLDLEDGVCAAPLLTSSQDKMHYWNVHEFQLARFKRPFHSTMLVWIDMGRWRESKAGDVYRELYRTMIKYHLLIGQIDDDLFNLMQLDVQVITLPEYTLFCSRHHRQENAGTAFAHLICDVGSSEFLGKEFEEIKEQAARKYIPFIE
jgi:hypothetical protein